MKLFKDLGDIAKKLLNDDFVTDNKFKLVTSSSDGSSYTLTATSPDASSSSSGVTGELSVKAKCDPVTLVAKLPTSSSDPTVEAKYEKKVGPTPTSKARSVSASVVGGPSKLTAKADMVHGQTSLSLDVDVLKKIVTGSTALAIVPSRYRAYAVVGARGSYSVSDGSMSNTHTAVSIFDGSSSELSCYLYDTRAQKLDVSYSHLVRPNMKVAAIMHCDRLKQSATATMACALALDTATTVKAKVNTEGLAALSYIQQIRHNTELVLSTSFNATKMDTAKVGASLTFE